MAEQKLNVTVTDTLPAAVSPQTKKKIHEEMKSLVEKELAKEAQTLGAGATKPTISIHGSIEIRF
jgi:hypothetical protein